GHTMTTMTTPTAMATMTTTVGILSIGEMGASVASMIRSRGSAMRVVTTLQGGRGERTAARCEQANVLVLSSLPAVVRMSNVFISLVPPDAADEVADAYCEHARLAPHDAVYVDANSIGPERKRAMADRIAQAGRGFVDVTINGLAKNLGTSG